MLITNAKLITWTNPNQILTDHALMIENGKIADIGADKELKDKYREEEMIDAKGQYVMPGNICAHTHFYSAFSTGMSIPGSAPKDFPEILSKLWWKLDKSLSLESIRYSALVCLIDAIRHGTTTLFDHHASPNAISGSLEEIAEAVDQAGVRASLCYEVTDRDGIDKAKTGIEENMRFIDFVINNKNTSGRLAATFGLHSSLTLSEKTLEASRNAAPDGIGFHIHAAEHPGDEFDSLGRSGMRVVDRLQKHGILNSKSILVHGVHLDAKEIDLVSRAGAWIVHNPRSNMNNAVGLPPVESIIRMGVKVCLGNDGFSNNMWEEWKTAYLAHKLWHHDPRCVGGYDLIKMAVYNNSDLAQAHFGKKIGILTKGAEADLIIVNFHPHTPLTVDNLPWQMLFAFRDTMVTTTIVAGKVLMHNGELATLDEEKIYREAQNIAPAVWRRFNNQS